jgi:hypothetical protein
MAVRSTTSVRLAWLAKCLAMGTPANVIHACERLERPSATKKSAK